MKNTDLEHTAAIAERLTDFLVAAWREITAPPRAAWIIIATRSAKRRGELSHRFAPR